jgi:hypothetical protein
MVPPTTFKPSLDLKFPQLSNQMSGRVDPLLIYSIQHCGGRADMG